jgi:uncharacterized protein (DUF362 family)
VAAVARACVAAGAKRVLVADYTLAKTEPCLERSGVRAALATLEKVELRMLGKDEDFEPVEVPGGVSLKVTHVAKIVRSADVLINLPVAKAHKGSIVSLGLKNAMGLIRDRRIFHTELDLHQAIADLGRVILPQLTLLDATRVLLTNGPGGPGEVEELKCIVAGRSVASVDAYGCTLAKFNGKQLTAADVRHIALAGEAGLGEIDLEKLLITRVTV